VRSPDDNRFAPPRSNSGPDAPARRRGSRGPARSTTTPDLGERSEPQEPIRRDGGRWLKDLLLGLDALAVALAWCLALSPSLIWGTTGGSVRRSLLAVVLMIGTSLAVISSQGLYRARVCGVRAVEVERLGKASVVSALGAFIVSRALGYPVSAVEAGVGMAATFLLLVTFRGLYGAWLRRGRVHGRFCRPVVLIGTGTEGGELARLLELHPELGYRVVGVVGPRERLNEWRRDVAWLGPLSEAAEILRGSDADGVIIAVSDIGADDLNLLTRELLRDKVHVHLSSGLRGIDHRRLRALPFAHEPLFYLEPVSLARWQLVVKRAMDIVTASLALLFAAPFLAVSALAVKLGDRGPVLFHQTRIGRDGEPFTLFKLRTMVPNAEARLVDLTFVNQRKDGPLFKLEQDPRRTKVGRILERTSIDELPQLFNVLRGEMSIVGPRPALPHEVAQFDQELLGRQQVLPGITGLWQVEGREHPSFDVYRRLDLFYVENWSVGLDFAIIFATAQAVLGRVVRTFARRPPTEAPVSGPRALESVETATEAVGSA
jgi:exopolysaccharide biosynthesis polyprenyl glycosylphosphotransferase